LGLILAKKKKTSDITSMQRIFIITAIILTFSCLFIVYLSDTGVVPIEDTTWYKILAASSLTTVGGYLFGSSNARK